MNMNIQKKAIITFCLSFLLSIFLYPQEEKAKRTCLSAEELFTHEEFQSRLIPAETFFLRQLIPLTPWEQINELMARTTEEELPAELDYRQLGLVSPVKDQGEGACWVFSAIGTVESAIMKHNGGQVVDISEEEISSCHPMGETAGIEHYAFSYILRKGIASEANYPWNPYDHACHPPAQPDYFINDYSVLNVSHLPLADRVRTIKSLLYHNGPVSTGFTVYTEFFEYNGQSVYFWTGDQRLEGGHALVIVGWKDDAAIVNGGYWICKNSWPVTWGENDFCRIAYGQLGIDDIVEYVSYNPDDPAPIFRIKGGIHYVQAGYSIDLEISARSNRGAAISYCAENLPPGATYDAENGNFSWTPDGSQLGSFAIRFLASDGQYTTSKEFTFIISDYFQDID
jgi:C1A family cysteine protease